MEVCLVIPPSVFLLDERVFVSLGVLRVAAVLRNAGHRVEVLDLSGVKNYQQVVRDHASTSRSTWYGITTTTPQMPATYEILHEIQKVAPNVTTCVGGPHPTLVVAAAKKEAKENRHGRASAALAALRRTVDVVVAGDGEEAIHQAIQHSWNPCTAVDGALVIDADDLKSPLFLTNAQYERLPYPARELVDMSSYHYQIEGFPATSLIAQLGCPFQCAFCGGRASPMLRKIRMRSSESIVQEMEHLYTTFGYRGFMFYDDELNVNRKFEELLVEVTKLQERLGQEFRLRGFVKSELFTRRQADLMRAAGFRWLLTGFESGSDRILENIRKNATKDDNTRCVETAHAAGLKVKALMSVGHPGESPETIGETEDWLRRVRPDDFDITIITTYPGSPYYDDAVETSPRIWTYTARNGDRLHSEELDYSVTADYYKGDPDGGYRAYVFTDHLGKDSLVWSRDHLEKTLRSDLGIPFNQSAAAINYEHSMGQLPSNILRVTP